jgi:hypothetical protein
MFLLILIAVGSTTGVGGSLNQTGPTILGTFPSMAACQAAASGAQIIRAGELPKGGHTGAEFMCVQGQ